MKRSPCSADRTDPTHGLKWSTSSHSESLKRPVIIGYRVFALVLGLLVTVTKHAWGSGFGMDGPRPLDCPHGCATMPPFTGGLL